MNNPVLLFDLDDTLLDDSATKAYYLPKLFTTYNALIHHDFETFRKRWIVGIDKYWKLYVQGKVSFQKQRFLRIEDAFANQTLSNTQLEKIVTDFDKYFEASWQLFDGVFEFLTAHKEIKMGLITNGNSDQQRKKIEKLGIEPFFDSMIISDEVGLKKPDIKIFEMCCDQMGCNPGECYYIGDSIYYDVKGAINAGMKPVWVNNYNAVPDETLTGVIEIKSVLEMKRILEI